MLKQKAKKRVYRVSATLSLSVEMEVEAATEEEAIALAKAKFGYCDFTYPAGAESEDTITVEINDVEQGE